MKKYNPIIKTTSLLFLFFFCSEANAYIDPGSGSLILQGLIAGIAMGMYTLKLYWYKIKNFFTPRKKEENVEEEE